MKTHNSLDDGSLDDGYEPIRHYGSDPCADPAVQKAYDEAERELNEIVEIGECWLYTDERPDRATRWARCGLLLIAVAVAAVWWLG